MEKDETKFRVVPETITTCVNNCDLTGNPTTNNMCQKCLNSTTSTSSSFSAAGAIKFGDKLPRSSSLKRSSPEKTADRAETSRYLNDDVREDTLSTAVPASVAKREVNRCSGCRRKVGFTGFLYRCGDLFCSEHRYSDRRDCSYDYKVAGRETIAREKPMFKAVKIVKV